jgi:predicted amidohydrolase YtcJ
MCAGSDWAVTSANPFRALHVAVNRALPVAAGGYGREPFLPEQALDLPAALANYTSGSAAVNGVGDRAGRIGPGVDADLVVVDADLAHVSASDLCFTTVRQTFVRGALAYSAG